MGMDDRAFVKASFKRAGKELSDPLLHETIEGKSEIHRGLIEQDLPFFPGVLTF